MKKLHLMLAGVISSMLMASGASAAVPTAVTDMITTLGTDATSIFTACVAFWVIVRSSTAIMRLGNRFLGKAGG